MDNMDSQRQRYETQLEEVRKQNDELHAEVKTQHEMIENGLIELKREKQHLEFREREFYINSSEKYISYLGMM